MESTSGTWSIGVHAFANWLCIAKVRTYSVSPVGTSGHPDPKCKSDQSVRGNYLHASPVDAIQAHVCFNEQQLLRDPGPQLHRPGQATSQGSPIQLVSSHLDSFGGKFFQSALFAYKLISISDVGCSSLVEALLVRIGGQIRLVDVVVSCHSCLGQLEVRLHSGIFVPGCLVALLA